MKKSSLLLLGALMIILSGCGINSQYENFEKSGRNLENLEGLKFYELNPANKKVG